MRAIPDRQAESIESLSRAGRIPLPAPPSVRPSKPGAYRRAQPCEELAQGLMQRQAQISPKFLYDAHGCALFEQITRLPEYYPTRTEAAIMTRFERDIAEAMAPRATSSAPRTAAPAACQAAFMVCGFMAVSGSTCT